MNLVKLFEFQKGLDAPYSHVEDRLSKDILWLMEELGELAREWRGHKYRRPEEKQQPRVIAWVNTENPDHACAYNPLLEEYTDCLSIILSIGLQIGFDKSVSIPEDKQNTGNHEIIIDRFIELQGMARELYYEKFEDNFGTLVWYFMHLGVILEFTWEQIEQNYLQKVITNGKRNC